MPLRDETLEIFKRAFGTEEAYKVMEFIESRIPEDVATRRDIYELKLEIEKVRAETERVRADLTVKIEKVRADLTREIEKVRADLTREIEKVRADTRVEIEKVRRDLGIEIERMRSSLLQWSFLFWISQMALLAGILFKLLSS